MSVIRNFVFVVAVFIVNVAVCRAACPYKFKPNGNNCYLIVSKVLANWFEAKTFCSIAGGDLATIESKDEETFIENELKAIHGNATGALENYWLDGSDIIAEGEWRWMGREGNSRMIIGYTAWAPGQPDNGGTIEHCLEIRYTFGVQWNDLQCETAQKFICKSRRNDSLPGRKTTVEPFKCHEKSSMIGNPEMECLVKGATSGQYVISMK